MAGILREIAPEAEIGSFRVLDMSNQSQSEMICFGAHLAIERGYHILNCSFGARHKPQVLMFKDWVDRAYLSGVHVVSACNNEDFRKPEWPGDFGTVITVNMLATPERERSVPEQSGNDGRIRRARGECQRAVEGRHPARGHGQQFRGPARGRAAGAHFVHISGHLPRCTPRCSSTRSPAACLRAPG